MTELKNQFLRATITMPFTKKPIQVRMGKGKGAIESYVYPAGKSRIFLEMNKKIKILVYLQI